MAEAIRAATQIIDYFLGFSTLISTYHLHLSIANVCRACCLERVKCYGDGETVREEEVSETVEKVLETTWRIQ